MSELYDNLLKATDNTNDITTEKYAIITKINGNICSAKEIDSDLEHSNVPIMNGADLKLGDKVIIGFLNNSIYDIVCYGVLDRTVETDWENVKDKPSDYPPSTHNHDDLYYTESEVDTALNGKQDTLISGTNIKTINNTSLLGSGNINIQGGGTVTSLTVSNYNPRIDSNVTLTVTVEDVYGDPVVGGVVTVTASAGDFTALNGGSITASATVDGTTDASGQFTLTYTCSEWGLVTFSANNTSKQVHVTGWREITAGTGRLWVNDETKIAKYFFARTGAITTAINYDNVIPSGYRPFGYVRMRVHNNASVFLIIETNGTVRIRGTSQDSITASCQITYGY